MEATLTATKAKYTDPFPTIPPLTPTDIPTPDDGKDEPEADSDDDEPDTPDSDDDEPDAPDEPDGADAPDSDDDEPEVSGAGAPSDAGEPKGTETPEVPPDAG